MSLDRKQGCEWNNKREKDEKVAYKLVIYIYKNDIFKKAKLK